MKPNPFKLFLPAIAIAAIAASVMVTSAQAQNPVFGPGVNIDQQQLLKNKYSLKKILESGGDFYTTPYQPYNPATGLGDGHGEGNNGVPGQQDGPRAAQRHAFNPLNPKYPFLRMNGIDSQSCFECHNSIGSSNQFVGTPGTAALMRKPFSVAGSAGGVSNAFINPNFPTMLTLFIRNPPHVFGSGYTQTLAGEITAQLLAQRAQARQQAMQTKNMPVSVPLVANGLSFGTFTTTYNGSATATVAANASCPAAASSPLFIGGAAGFADDVTKVTGVNCDLVVRPFQWKGVASSIRHFVRDALDFHFSMQAFEKVALCDCDRDGKPAASSFLPNGAPGPNTHAEVSIGNVTALTAFVSMTRPPVQVIPADKKLVVALGQAIFNGSSPSLPPTAPQAMCATCHVPSQTVRGQFLRIEGPTQAAANSGDTNQEDQLIVESDPSTWPISPAACPRGQPSAGTCPAESSYGGSLNKGSLVSPVARSTGLAVQRRLQLALQSNAKSVSASGTTLLKALDSVSLAGDYKIPLTPAAATVTPYQLPRLPVSKDGSIPVPLFSDLRTHDMGPCLADPTPSSTVPAQGTDVAGINTVYTQFLTRPLWGVADTGPWLHDGRALTLLDAIKQHGNSVNCQGSEAASVIDTFEQLTDAQREAVVQFLLTLQLPLPAGTATW